MNKTLFLVGRAGIGFVFIYFGINSILDPETFTRLVPAFATDIMSANTWVTIHGFLEAIFGALLVIGIGRKVPMVILCLTLLPVIFLVSGMIRIRDIGIFSALLVLISIELGRESELKKQNMTQSSKLVM